MQYMFTEEIALFVGSNRVARPGARQGWRLARLFHVLSQPHRRRSCRSCSPPKSQPAGGDYDSIDCAGWRLRDKNMRCAALMQLFTSNLLSSVFLWVALLLLVTGAWLRCCRSMARKRIASFAQTSWTLSLACG